MGPKRHWLSLLAVWAGLWEFSSAQSIVENVDYTIVSGAQFNSESECAEAHCWSRG